MKKISELILQNNVFYARLIIAICFFGHGLVSLDISPGYQLHYSIFSSINYFHFDVIFFLRLVASFDLIMAFLFLFNVHLLYVIPFTISYLLLVGIAGGLFFMQKTQGYFGMSEFFRRLPWMCTTLFLWFVLRKKKRYYFLLRIGLAFAFLAHGLSSLGFLGLRGGHVELASQILSEAAATQFVYYSGFTDTSLGILLMSGILSRLAATISIFWLFLIVFLSFLTGLPEGLFRTGFLLISIYVAIDKRCHYWKEEKNQA